MADKTKTDNPTVSVADLAAVFQTLVEQIKPKEFDYNEFINRPENRDPAEQLTTPVLQHGHPIQIRGCSQDTIKHLNELVPGEYIGGRVKVTLKGQPPHQHFHIDYPWQTAQDRMHNHTLFTSFSDLVQKINQEQKAKTASKDS